MNCKKVRMKILLAMDNRLETTARVNLQNHLDLCQSCRNWRQEQLAIQGLFRNQNVIEASPWFFQKLQTKINGSSNSARFFFIKRIVFKPLLLRAAMVLIMIFAAAVGYSIGNRLNGSSTETAASAFNQTMNLNTFADLPTESFGAVYDNLLQGGRP